MLNQATSEHLYNRYNDADNHKLKASYLLLLKNRASWGSSEAQKFVDKTEGKTK